MFWYWSGILVVLEWYVFGTFGIERYVSVFLSVLTGIFCPFLYNIFKKYNIGVARHKNL